MKIVTLCGSTKFKDTFEMVNRSLTLKGYVVLAPGVFGHADEREVSDDEKEQLDKLHKYKIDLSDFIYVINVDGYIGKSTASEIKYAKEHEKSIYYLVPNERGDQK